MKKEVCLIASLLIMVTFSAVVSLTGCSDQGAQQSADPIEQIKGSDKNGSVIPDKGESRAATDSERAEEILACMTLDQKIGQIVLARCPGVGYVDALKRFGFGGYVLYENNFDSEDGIPLTKSRVSDMIESISRATEIPPFIAVDEEGGTVVRLSGNPNLVPDGPFRAPQEILKNAGEEELYEDAEKKSRVLLDYGIDINLAPVVDVATTEDSFIYERSMGADFSKTAELTAGVVTAMSDAGIGSVLKHFPGYGDGDDSHGMVASDSRPLGQYKEKDFLPFEAGIGAGADGVMMSHILAEGIDRRFPVSLSEKAHRILREDLGFDGVIIADDLWMIDRNKFEIDEEIAPLAVKAGNDMIVSTTYERDIAKIHTSVHEGKLSEERLDEAVLRVLKWKIKLGVLE